MKLKIGSLGLFDDYHNSSLILVQLLTYKLGRLGKSCLTLWSPFVSCSKMIQMVLCQPLLKFSTTKVFQWQILFQLIGFKSSHVAYIEKHCYEAVLQYKKQKKTKNKRENGCGFCVVLVFSQDTFGAFLADETAVHRVPAYSNLRWTFFVWTAVEIIHRRREKIVLSTVNGGEGKSTMEVYPKIYLPTWAPVPSYP